MFKKKFKKKSKLKKKHQWRERAKRKFKTKTNEKAWARGWNEVIKEKVVVTRKEKKMENNRKSKTKQQLEGIGYKRM